MNQLKRCFDIIIPKPEAFLGEADEVVKKQEKTKTFQIYEETDEEDEEEPEPENEKSNIISKNNDESDNESSDDDFVEVPLKTSTDTIDELRYLGFFNDRNSEFTRHYNLQIDIGIKESEENKIIRETMREMYKELENAHLKKLNKWIKVYFD